MIKIKTTQDIQKMKKSGEILAEVKQIVFDAIKAGVTTKHLDDVAYNAIIERGGKPAFKGYGGFPGTACISINEEMIHGIPGNRILKDGDIVKVDMGVIYDGWYSDSAFTKGIGEISKKDKELIQVAKDAFYIGLDAIKPGARIGDISAAIGEFVAKKGYRVPYDYSGHGIGKALHEDPFIPNWGTKGTGALIQDGMVFAIEPMILQTSSEVKILSDKWTVIALDGKNTSHYEHTVAIVNGKPEILTGDM